jgi:predicted GIY-YIG superfamily endonuclease
VDESTTVYQYFAVNGALIYVGITNRGSRRLHEHADSKPWWHLATGCTLEHFASREAALAREELLIRTFRPPYNSQHNPERAQPVDERARKRLRSAASLGVTGDVKQRRQDWYALSSDERRRAACARCQTRPSGLDGPECLPCRQSRALSKAT